MPPRATACFLLWAAAHAAEEVTLTVQVGGLSATGGELRVALFNAAAGFPGDPAQAQLRQVLKAAALPPGGLVFRVAPGTWAVSVHHDLDADGKLAANWLGIPREPVGVSRDAKGGMGPPSFADAAFPVGAGGATVAVTVR